jgi:hypothetical protein
MFRTPLTTKTETPSDQELIARLLDMELLSPPSTLGGTKGLGLRVSHGE